ncbi:alpha/beta fold hydrolase [Longimycelium tulufanense]|uniref:alpha/beta fold hydrolase n=1 Tax=Longimycelium tulufanense TaxID=907463 RepID=UPI00166CFE7D|nr:alpha/beta hydrolase [Longimycelium tulufanense]
MVVFVHGLCGNLSTFYYSVAMPVTVAGARTVLYDMRGHGRSERTRTGYTTADSVADLFAILDALGHSHPVYLVAYSFSGVIALNAALRRPERIAGMVLIDAYGPGECAGESTTEWTEKVLNALSLTALGLEYGRIANQRCRRWMRAWMAGLDALINGTSLLDDLATIKLIRPAQLAAVACPVLAVYGEHSDVIEARELLVQHVPDCTLHVMAGCAHFILRDSARELLDVMLPWLAQHTGNAVPVVS